MTRSRARPRAVDYGAVADLYGYLAPRSTVRGRPPKHDLARWRVVDDWPPDRPVTTAEVEVLEAWFGDILDELFGAADVLSAACRDGEQK